MDTRETWDNSIGIATPKFRTAGVRFPIEESFFSSPKRQDRLWDPTNLVLNGYQGLFTGGGSGRGV
jgi:hypothetical protein